MFKGEYHHSIDTKGRLTIPVKLREALGETFVVTKGLDGCLFAFDAQGWSSFEEKLRALPLDNADARQLSRFFLAGAVDAEFDKQGRILLPATLLSYAAITKDAVVAGVGLRAEIWSDSRWEAASAFEDIEDIAAKMSSYGLSI